MADGIRKPWLLDYLIAYAEQHGARLSSTRPKRGKVQIINFRTLPESPREWVWADVSDKQHTIAVRFTMEAVQAFNDDPRNAGRRLTSRRWGVTTIQCIQPLWCRLPTHAGKGLEEQMTLALVVDQIEVAGSEGEAMFGEPRSVSKEEPIRRWIEGLRDPHGGGGNILQQERLERQKQEKERAAAIKSDSELPRRPLDVVLNVESHALRTTDNPKTSSRHQRLRQWHTKMKELRLVLTHRCHEIPEDQQQILKDIVVFGLNSPIETHSQITTRIIEDDRGDSLHEPSLPPELENKPQIVILSSLQNDSARGPTTPSHWSASQRTNMDQESDDNEQPSDLPDVISGQNADDDDEDLQEQALALPEPPQWDARKPVILVPDSDVSGSQSQPLSLTQPSNSLPSQQKTSEMVFPVPSSHDTVPKTLYLQRTPVRSKPRSESDGAHKEGEDAAEIDQLESDDEAAKRILNSDDAIDHRTSGLLARPKHTMVNFEPATVSPLRDQVNQSSRSRADSSPEMATAHVVTPTDGPPAASGSDGQPMPYTSVGMGPRGMKRTLRETTTPNKGGEENERPFKRQKGKSQEVVVERVEHNAVAWKDPSFVRSRTKSEARSKETRREHPERKHEMETESTRYRATIPREERLEHAQRHPPGSRVTATAEASEREPYTTNSTIDTRPGSTAPPGAPRNFDYQHPMDGPGTGSESFGAMIAPPLITRAPGWPSGSQLDTAKHLEKHRERSPGPRHSPPRRSMVSASDMSSVRHKQKPLKLGGWRPRGEIEPGLGIITWKDLNKILLTVGCVREQQSKTK